MTFGKLLVFSLLCNFMSVLCMEPIAPFASQPVWQAGEPIAVNVDYDVPAFGPQDAVVNAQGLSQGDGRATTEQVRNHDLSADGRSYLTLSEHPAASNLLATRVLPVDAERIKKSWYLTQSLRSPPQASVNLIMHENVQGMKDASNYKGMVDQTRHLHDDFSDALAAFRHTAA